MALLNSETKTEAEDVFAREKVLVAVEDGAANLVTESVAAFSKVLSEEDFQTFGS